MAEKMKLSDILLAYLDFKKNPNEETEKTMREYAKVLVVREYLSMLDKQLALTIILNKIENNEKDAVATSSNLEICQVIYGMLLYCVNLENDLGFEALLNAKVVDAVYESGMAEFILSHCREDYKILCNMVDRALNFSNIIRITETCSLFSSENLEEFKKVSEELKTLMLDKDSIKKLADIYQANDPQTLNIIEALKSGAALSAAKAAAKAGDE